MIWTWITQAKMANRDPEASMCMLPSVMNRPDLVRYEGDDVYSALDVPAMSKMVLKGVEEWCCFRYVSRGSWTV